MASCIISVARDTARPILMTGLCPGISPTAQECEDEAGCTDKQSARWTNPRVNVGQGHYMTLFASSYGRCSHRSAPAIGIRQHRGTCSRMYVQYVDGYVTCLPFVSQHSNLLGIFKTVSKRLSYAKKVAWIFALVLQRPSELHALKIPRSPCSCL